MEFLTEIGLSRMISKYVNFKYFGGLKSNFLACFVQNLQCVHVTSSCYSIDLYNTYKMVPEVDNNLNI